jgi:CubicO group peptidase (beta-lactamase class C family)
VRGFYRNSFVQWEPRAKGDDAIGVGCRRTQCRRCGAAVGCDNSWVEIDGKKVQSVTGGGHWGGGMFINAYDMARFGYLFLRNGKWKDREIANIIYIDWENDVVAVFRWIAGDGTNNSVEKIIASLKAPAKTTTSSAGGR